MKKRTTRMISFLIAVLMFFTTVVSGTPKEAFAATATKAVVEDGLCYLYSAKASGIMKYGISAGCASYVSATYENEKITNEGDSLKGAAVINIKYDSNVDAYTMMLGDKYLAANASEELYLSDKTSDTKSACTYWILETVEGYNGYTIKSKSIKYSNNDVYMEYYSNKGFCLYTAKTLTDIYFFELPKAAEASDTDKDGFAYGTVPVAQPLPAVGSHVVIHNASGSQVIGGMLEGTAKSMAAVEATVSEDSTIEAKNGGLIFELGLYREQKTDYSKAGYFTVTKNEDGTYTFSKDGNYLKGYSSSKHYNLVYTTDSEQATKWTIASAGEQFILTTEYNGETIGLEYYKSNFTVFSFNTSDTSKWNPYKMEFVKEDGTKVTELQSGDEIAFFHPVSKTVMSATQTSDKFKFCSEVAVVDEEYYYFKNNDKYLAANDKEELFLQEEFNEYTQWDIVETLGGYLLKNRKAAWKSSSGNSYPIYIEYFSGSFAGYSYKATSSEIFTFNFFEVEDEYNCGYVINPSVIFRNSSDAFWYVDYTMNFSLDDNGVADTVSALVTFEDGTKKNYPVTMNGNNGAVTIKGADMAGHTSLEVKLLVKTKQEDRFFVEYEGTTGILLRDEPVIVSVSPESGAQTGENKKPEIKISYANIGNAANATLKLNGKYVSLSENKVGQFYSYVPASNLSDGKVSAEFTVTRKDGKSVTKQWVFYIGKQGVSLYFGQIHAHTAEYSDGSGTLEEAYEYAKNTAEDVDYLIITDHSNYFDTTSTAVKDSIYDSAASSILASETVVDGKVLNKWEEAKLTASKYTDEKFIAAYGYEMTWSGGPGHINVFNSLGIVSRNNTELNNKKDNAGMFAFYDLIEDANKKGATWESGTSISGMFNHPGTTFGTFGDFAGYTEERDAFMNLMEVGNGDGAVGGTAYFPSYEYYDMALAMGWHIAPTNGQDNHKGAWGDANTCRTVVLAESFSEKAIYEAMANRNVYSTEDQNLSILYYLNDNVMGSILDCTDENVVLSITLSDKDKEDIGYVYVCGKGGDVVYTSDYISGNTADLAITIPNTDPYYYVKVEQKDGDIAVTAPVWVADANSNKVNISSSMVTEDEDGEIQPVEGENVWITDTITNKEDFEIVIDTLEVLLDGESVYNGVAAGASLFAFARETGIHIAPGETKTFSYLWKPDKYGSHDVTFKYAITLPSGEAAEFTSKKRIYVKGTDYDKISNIADIHKANEGEEFTIEGIITANTSGYDKDTAFFDCTYVQDATGGINVFPVSDSFMVGQKVRVHGAVTYYNGEIELNISSDFGGYIQLLDEKVTPVAPTKVTCEEAMLDKNVGLLMKVTGKVTRIHEVSGVIDRIYIIDESGKEALIYINGYIRNSMTTDVNRKSFFGIMGREIKVGDEITAIGLGSIDADELGEVEKLHRLRVRDRAEINLTEDVLEEEVNEIPVVKDPGTVNPPKEGDTNDVAWPVVVIVLGITVSGVALFRRKQKRA